MTESDQAIVLNTTAFGDKQLILHCISSHWGRRSFIVSRSTRSGRTLFQPLSILDMEVSVNPKSDLWRARNISLKYPLASLRRNIAKTAIGLFMSEVLYRAVREGGQDDGLFAWCEKSVLTLESLEDDFVNYHIIFLLELAATLGFSPSEADLAPYAGEQYSLLRLFLTSSTAEAMLIRLNGEQRAALCRVIIAYLEHHTESRLEIRSLEVLHQLFN